MNIAQRVESLETDSLKDARQRLTSFEGKMSEVYLREIFKLIPENLRPAERQTFQAYDGVNNLFNMAYEILSWKVQSLGQREARALSRLSSLCPGG